MRADDEPEAVVLVGASSKVMVGTSSTATPSAVEAASAVPKLKESKVCRTSAVVEAGTAMVAVMRTLAAATLIVTSDLSTPAALATFCCKLDLSSSEYALTLPLAVSVSTTVSVEGRGGAGGGSEGVLGGDEGGWTRNVTVPTQSACTGAKMTAPVAGRCGAVRERGAQPVAVPLMVEGRGAQLKALIAGSKMPTQLASYGAKTTRPSLVVVAPRNANDGVDKMWTQLKALVVGSKMPTQSVLAGAKMTRCQRSRCWPARKRRVRRRPSRLQRT